ncbi:MAG: DNA-3-methyladenine glycosylase, partial [Actinomycetota bacterium]|nr:DNA-3-methyladenine glycosylase [Actinomycetota bacterium]
MTLVYHPRALANRFGRKMARRVQTPSTLRLRPPGGRAAALTAAGARPRGPPGGDREGVQSVRRPRRRGRDGGAYIEDQTGLGGGGAIVAGEKHLLGCGDRVMGDLVRRIGPLGPAERRRGRPEDAYGSLVRTIIGQQLSTKAARSIYGRLTALFDGRPPTPEELLSTDEEPLRACGLSRPKVRYLRDLAERVISGELDLSSLHGLPDEEVIRQITAVKGLGRWSADMFLMFHLGREDVLPVGDLGVRRAVERAYDLLEIPDAETLRDIARPWSPHRTLASFYLWESLEPDNAP